MICHRLTSKARRPLRSVLWLGFKQLVTKNSIASDGTTTGRKIHHPICSRRKGMSLLMPCCILACCQKVNPADSAIINEQNKVQATINVTAGCKTF